MSRRPARTAAETVEIEDLSNPKRGVRLQRVLADQGIAARRACEKLIEDGHVEVNGRVVDRLPIFVDPTRDRILVDGRPIRKTDEPPRKIYVMLHKPAKTLSVAADEPGGDRRTVTQLVEHPMAERLFPVGRLAYEATGLVLLTNDGDLANKLTHPRYGVAKTYLAVVKGQMSQTEADELAERVFVEERRAAKIESRALRSRRPTDRLETAWAEGVRASKPVKGAYRAAHVSMRVVKYTAGNSVLQIDLAEGRNKQVERVLSYVGHRIRKLSQVGIGPIKLRGLAVGEWRELERDEVISLRASVRNKNPSASKTGAGVSGARSDGSRASGTAKPRTRRPTARPAESEGDER